MRSWREGGKVVRVKGEREKERVEAFRWSCVGGLGCASWVS